MIKCLSGAFVSEPNLLDAFSKSELDNRVKKGALGYPIRAERIPGAGTRMTLMDTEHNRDAQARVGIC